MPPALMLEAPVIRRPCLSALTVATLLFGGCAAEVVDEVPDEANPLPAFEEDCGSGVNDSLETASGLGAEDEAAWEGVRLCTDDVDYYRIDVPRGRWASVKITIDGDGDGQTDLDLYEVDAEDEVIWASASGQPFERLAWFNDTDAPVSRFLRVEGYGGARADYDILVRVDRYHDSQLDCDDAYTDEDADDERGPCNRIMQFPQGHEAAGYLVTHEPHYSNLRREVQYLVRLAAARTALQFSDTEPLGLLDMSQWDGDTPGRMVGQLRHPEGTHAEGNDIDISYYSLSDGNEGKIVCPQNDGYFCTGPASDLDVERTTYFLAQLVENVNVRVMGVDTQVALLVEPMAQELEDDGVITREQRQRVQGLLAYGSGWPFHHHHVHLSWMFEDGFEGRDVPPDGCMTGPGLAP